MTVYVADAHAHVQLPVMRFFFAGKRTRCKGYLKRNVPCLCLEVFVAYSGSKLGGKRFIDDEEVETEVQKWLRQQPKDFFDALVKRWDTCINVGGGYIKK
jgi:hypothetical protein